MTSFRVAAVQTSYVLMDREATIDRVAQLTAEAAQEGAQVVVLPEAFVPGTPIWTDTRPIWDGDADGFALLVVGVNPVLHRDGIPADFPHREELLPASPGAEASPWVEPGNTVIVAPDGAVVAGPVREREETLIADLDLRFVAAQRRLMDPTGHYNRPDVFRLLVDTSARQAVVTTANGFNALPTEPSLRSSGVS